MNIPVYTEVVEEAGILSREFRATKSTGALRKRERGRQQEREAQVYSNKVGAQRNATLCCAAQAFIRPLQANAHTRDASVAACSQTDNWGESGRVSE